MRRGLLENIELFASRIIRLLMKGSQGIGLRIYKMRLMI